MPCWQSGDCLPAKEKSVFVEMQMAGLQPSSLRAEQLAELLAAYAQELASACDVANGSVVDLGGVHATVSLASDGLVSAFVLALEGLTAHDLAARLYSPSFRYAMGNASEAVLGHGCGVQVVSVSVVPKAFVRATTASPTTAATTTEATTSTKETSHAPKPTSTVAPTTRENGNSGTRPHGNFDDLVGHHTTSKALDINLGGYSNGAATPAAWPALAIVIACGVLR